MNSNRKKIALLTVVFLSAAAFAGSRLLAGEDSAGLPPAAAAAMRAINPENLRAHVRFLSHDLLEGRGTGARGGEIAAEYIATQFALAGLKPGGDNGSFLQKVPMMGVQTLPETTFTLQSASGAALPLKMLDDYVAGDQTQRPSSDIDAPVVFVGFGIHAPEYKWDDFKGLDLRGKVLVMFVAEPSSDDPQFFKGKALTYYGRWVYKYEEAARRGAVAALVIHRTDLASYGWEVVRNSWSGERSYIERDSTPVLQGASWITWDVAKKLVAFGGQDLEKLFAAAQSRDFQPIELPVRLKAHIASKLRPFVSTNVLAYLPGADAARRSEAVFFTAHYDHFGINPDLPGDKIFNGAMDNATGCGILLELARAYGSLSAPPARSVYFAAVTAEEQGLLGSEFLGKHPPLPRGKIALDLNFDNVPPLGDPEETEVSGAERTTFFPQVEETAKAFALAIKPDPVPEAGHYYRSDHFSLARVGVPAFSVNQGAKFAGHSAEWGLAQAKDYVDHRYHQPSDEYKSDMDFSGTAKIARFGFALGWKAATLPALPAWLPGDEFEFARKASQKP